MVDLRKIIGPGMRGKIMYALSFLPDKPYLRLFYFATTGKMINFKNPKGFNEKLQWLKVNDKHPEYSKLVDKLAVREHIKKVLGEEYLFPLLGYWESFEEIDFSKLPNQFVLKCNHDSGSVRIIKDKSILTKEKIEELRNFYNRRVAHDFFWAGREYPYKGIKPYIMAEKFMEDEKEGAAGIKDYKFFCFNGEPKLLLSVSGRQTEKHEDYFDMDYNYLHIRNGSTESDVCPEKPECFEKMKEFARILSKDMRQVRMDFYEINGRVYFGEYTFFSGGGFEWFHPDEWERKLGNWIDLT